MSMKMQTNIKQQYNTKNNEFIGIDNEYCQHKLQK